MLGLDDFAGLKEAIESRQVVLFYSEDEALKSAGRFFGASPCGADSIRYNGFEYWLAVKWLLTSVQAGCVVGGRDVCLQFELKAF
jgi:hypothetical protein